MTDRRFAIMEGEDDVAHQFLTTPRRPPLRVTLANPRESGIIEFFTAIREGNIDEVREKCTVRSQIQKQFNANI